MFYGYSVDLSAVCHLNQALIYYCYSVTVLYCCYQPILTFCRFKFSVFCRSDKVIALIEQALQRPMMQSSDNLESERQESRSVCLKSMHHQSDCILRHLLMEFVTALKSQLHLTASNFPSQSALVITYIARFSFLQKLSLQH